MLIDDLGPECIKADHVKRWLDKRKFKAEKKYGSVDIRPLVIVITSNYHPRDVWPREADHAPILDRVEVIHMEKLRAVDDTPSSKKRKADAEVKRPKYVRQDAMAPYIPESMPQILEPHYQHEINIIDSDDGSACLKCECAPCICDIM